MLMVFTTAYRAGLEYLPAFLSGLAEQTDSDFHLIVAVDDVEEAELAPYLTAAGPDLAARTATHRAEHAADHVALRQEVLLRTVPGTSGVVLMDSDDVPLPTRVAAARAALAKAEVAACALELTDEAGTPTGGRFGTEPIDDWASVLARSNVVGFGNAAYRSEVLLDCLPAPAGTRLLDWLVAVRALASGAHLTIDPTPRARYRLHGASSAGVTRPFTEAQLLKATALVANHYALALSPMPSGRALPPGLRALIELAAADLREFQERVIADEAERNAYLNALNADPRVFRWWEWLDSRRQEAT